MPDISIYFFAFFGIAILELILSSLWNAAYFRYGIKIYSAEYDLPKCVNAEVLANRLEIKSETEKSISQFKYKRIGENQVGFREKMLDFRMFAFRYTPIMHGIINIDDYSTKVKISGLLNWSIVLFIGYWYAVFFLFFGKDMSFEGGPVFLLMFVLGPILVCGIIYLIQSAKYRKIAEFMKEACE
jgi:hypothetical protein